MGQVRARSTSGRRGWNRTLYVAALVAFATTFITYGLTLEPAYSNELIASAPRVGDVDVWDAASGKWVKQRSSRVAPMAAAPTHRVPTHRAPTHRALGRTVAQSQSAAAFARAHQLQWKDHGSYGVLNDHAVRIRVYANDRKAVVMGRQRNLKQPILRRNGQFILPSCVATLFANELAGLRRTQYETYQARQYQLSLARNAPRTPIVAAPRRVVTPVVRAQPKPPTPVRPKATPKPARAADSLPDSGWAVRGVTERKWKWIILHHSDDTSGNAAKYDRIHRHDNGWEHGLGYHFVIGNGTQSRDGEVEVGPRWQKQLHGAHAKTPDNRFNDYGVGICLVGQFDTGTGRPTAAQMDHLVRLVRWLQNRYGIAGADIQGHCDCCPTACPGKNFPWEELRRRIR